MTSTAAMAALPRSSARTILANRDVTALSLLLAVHALLLTVVLLPGTPLDALRSAVAFFYLLLVPGLLIVSLLRLYPEDPLARLVTAVGLSLIYVMVLGLVLSGIPASLVARPLSAEVFVPVSLAITAALSLGVREEHRLLTPLAPFANPRYLLWGLLPLSAVAVALHVQGGGSTLWMVVLLGVITATPLLLLVRRPTATECVVALFSIALALAFHKYFVLAGPHGDARLEFFDASQILVPGRWFPQANNLYEAMLSVTVLPVVHAEAARLGMASVFKILFPITLALIPATIFLSLRKLLGAPWAVAAAVLYLGHISFGAISGQSREITATLLLALVVLASTIGHRGGTTLRLLQIILALGVVFSHYSMVPILVIAFGTSLLVRRLARWHLRQSTLSGVALPSLGVLLATAVFAYFWFTWASGERLFNTFASIGARIVEAFGSELLFDREAASISVGVIPDGNSYVMLLLANWAIVLGSLVGLAACVYGILRKNRAQTSLAFLGIGGVVLGGIFLLLPQTSESLNTHRAFFMTFVWLLPLSVYAVKWSYGGSMWLRRSIKPVFGVIAGLVLLLYVGLGTGLVTHLVGDEEFSFAFDPTRRFPSHDRAAVQSIDSGAANQIPLYTDHRGRELFRLIGRGRAREILSSPELPLIAANGFYLYLRDDNLRGQWVLERYRLGAAASDIKETREPQMVEFVNSVRDEINLVYSTGGSELGYSSEAAPLD